jgi:hypothetical protein
MGYDLPRLKQLVEELYGNPLLYLSANSKELFHTNFWLWLARLDPDATARIFMPSISNSPGEPLQFRTEVRVSKGTRLDMEVRSGAIPVIVIENKVKDYPRREQLERIAEHYRSPRPPAFVLVSLFGSPEGISPPWTHVSYGQISERIDAEAFEGGPFDTSLIREYKRFAGLISHLSELLPTTSSYDFFNHANRELYSYLARLRLWEVYQKTRASHMESCFQRTYHLDGLAIGYNINHQKATMGFEWPLPGFGVADGSPGAGVQIEDNQIRTYLYWKDHEIFDKGLLLAKRGILFSPNWKNRQGEFLNSYMNGAKLRNFIYQYDTIPVMTFDRLFEDLHARLLAVRAVLQAVAEALWQST